MRRDRFAEIAKSYSADISRGLIEPKPIEIIDKITELQKGDQYAFEPFKKSGTKEELYGELEQLKKKYMPFLQNHAPALKDETIVKEVKHFTYSLNGGPAHHVSIPHYGGPLGRHTGVYETTVDLPPFENKRVILAFGGVDYTADVFVNDSYAFSHEGFFAPFSGDVTELVHCGENKLRIVVKNDYRMMGENGEKGKITGNKIYAATGIGWDDPAIGWHHCPAGMGIYNYVRFEIKEYEYITDIFPRIYESDGEFWVECFGTELEEKDISFEVSVYGRNFRETIIENAVIYPSTNIEAGVGDTLTISSLNAAGRLGAGIPLKLGNGYNRFKIPIHIENPRLWTLDEPYLYQVQIKLIADGRVKSVKEEHFGIRTFTQDTKSSPKGAFYLNGKQIRLRGANTMGFEQQDVLKADFDQLVDDILLAKLCNMNFLRITQRPVQREVYDCCDMLGLMLQTDMPLFGVIRINQYCETLRQVEEMERLIRSHPSCILASYINEPFPNANNMPHRMIERAEMMRFFEAADTVIKLNNPERVTKHVDGDYDPPSNTMPDNHCYSMWYNGHGLDAGMLNKGYWLYVKPDWYYGCGEFGAEGLDFEDVMKRCYPKEWIAEPFDPNNIVCAQTGDFHYMFYETPHSMSEWVSESQRHQEAAVRLMTSAMRRNPMLNSFAIHLFIDAFPSGWMKTIMDFERTPKPAYFAYRDCLSKVFCNVRTDRYKFFENETVSFDTYLCDDDGTADEIAYFVTFRDKIIYSSRTDVHNGYSQGRIAFKMPQTNERAEVIIYMGALKNGKVLDYSKCAVEVFGYERLKPYEFLDYETYNSDREHYEELVRNGEKIVFSQLDEGVYDIFGKKVSVASCGMSPMYLVSRDTDHPCVTGFRKNDFSYWYDSEKDRLAPIIYAAFECEDAVPILTAGNLDKKSGWRSFYAAAEWAYGSGKVVICQLDTDNKEKNPVFVEFMNRMFEK